MLFERNLKTEEINCKFENQSQISNFKISCPSTTDTYCYKNELFSFKFYQSL